MSAREGAPLGVAAELRALGRAIDGTVIRPDAPGYEAARTPAVAGLHAPRPEAIVRCTSAGDVAAALAVARRCGLHATPRSGGHCFAGRSSTTGVVIDVSPMTAISVAGGEATVGAGVRLAGLYDALDEHGQTVPAGCGPTVGIAGLALGGGIGVLGRSHGLTCDHLVRARVVLADGRVTECDDQREADLFWALRGAGGGQFGVVTALTFATVAAPAVTTFHLEWPGADAPAVIAAWQEWAPTAPDELDASLRVSAGSDPDAPLTVSVIGVMCGTRAETDTLLGQLVARAGAEPESAGSRHAPFAAAKRALAGVGLADPPDRDGLVQLTHRSEFFRRNLPEEAIAGLVDLLADDRARGESRELAFTAWGGAYNRVPAAATAFAHRGERFLLEHVHLAGPGAPAGGGWARRSWAAVRPWGSGRVYPNFPDPELPDPARAYHGENRARLARVKRAYDPDRVFRFPQSL